MSYLLNYNPGTQQWGYPRRGGARLSGTIIVHTAECAADNVGEDTSAEGCANMIANRADYGSYHRLVDSDSIIDMLPWEYEAWQDSETNNWAVGISAALRTSDWAVMPADRRDRVYRNLAACAAEFVRYMAGKGIQVPLRRIGGAEARARVPGFCAHGDSGIARSDPGANFDWALFFAYTQAALNGSLSYASETIKPLTPEGDELSAQEVQIIVDAINHAFHRTKTELPADTTKAILDFKVDAEKTGGQINLGAFLAEYRHNNNRVVETTSEWILPEVIALRELVKQLSVAQGVTIDYEAIAKAVNDDAAKRMQGK